MNLEINSQKLKAIFLAETANIITAKAAKDALKIRIIQRWAKAIPVISVSILSKRKSLIVNR